jgi:hypothetical protein
MSVAVRNQSPGIVTIPAQYGGGALAPGQGVVINDTLANVQAAFGATIPQGFLSMNANIPSGESAQVQPVAQSYYLGRQTFSASGTYTPNPKANRVHVRLVGGGGGGGGVAASSASQVAVGAGGAAGAYVEQYIDPGAGNYPITGGAVTVGAAGAAGANTGGAGGTGGDTSVVIAGTTITAKGGPGGGFVASSASNIQAQGGGFATGSSAGDISTAQEPGGAGQGFGGTIGTSGFGGSSPFGAGGGHSIAAGAGNPGQGFGGGGSGGLSINASAAAAGGAGTHGYVIIDEYT